MIVALDLWGVGNQLKKVEQLKKLNLPTEEQTCVPQTNWLESPAPSALWTVEGWGENNHQTAELEESGQCLNEEVIYLVQSAHYALEGGEAHLSADIVTEKATIITVVCSVVVLDLWYKL